MLNPDLNVQLKEFYREVVIASKKIFSKGKKKVLMPLMSAALRSDNSANGKISLAQLSSAQDVCSLYPRRVRKLFIHLDLEHQELEKVKLAIKKNDLPSACEALITYYRESRKCLWLSQPVVQKNVVSAFQVEQILNDTFTFQSVTGKVPRHGSGLLDWTNQGPKVDKEWAYFLNRHYHLFELFVAYQKTGNLAYVHCLNNHVIDWIISNPSEKTPETWAQWRGLEAAFRVSHWASIFYGLQQVDEFTPAARLLMLSSVLDHAYYLRQLNSWGANWLIKEMNGLATVAVCWSEFKKAKQWLDYASDRLLNEINQQIYPDGVQKELTSHYHQIVVQDLQQFADLMENSGNPVNTAFKTNLERMWNYLAYSLRPDGHGLLNSDSDQNYNRPLIYQAAITYQRPDWLYIATNGKSGQEPKGELSTVFPWGGQMIMRNGWHTDAHWAFFDVGPQGIYYHIHQDKLHLSVAACGRDLLVDSGRYSYVRDQFWHYFRGSAGHNVILINGRGQKPDLKEWFKPMAGNYTCTPKYDLAKGTIDRGFVGVKGKAIHSRAVLYLRDKYWVVVDQISTDRPRQLELLWHYHPDCTVEIEGESVVSTDANVGNLRIVPVSELSWESKIVQGQQNPAQGWWSREYNHKVPNSTAVYSTKIKKSVIFAWILFPAKGSVPKLKVNSLPAPEGKIIFSVEISLQTRDQIEVCINEMEMIASNL